MGDKAPPPPLVSFYEKVCNGNQEALRFLCSWHYYCHEIDDIIDEKQYTPDVILTCLSHAASLYAYPFWCQHARELHLVVQIATSEYADSVRWENKDEPLWKRQIADVLRHAGNRMCEAIAVICGSYEHLREYSLALRAMCYQHHHDQYGNPH